MSAQCAIMYFYVDLGTAFVSFFMFGGRKRFRKRTDTDMITVSVHVGRASDFVSQTQNKDSAVPWQNPPKK